MTPKSCITCFKIQEIKLSKWKNVHTAELSEIYILEFLQETIIGVQGVISSIIKRRVSELQSLISSILFFPFPQRYIRRLLSDWYFSRITILNSPPSEGDPTKLFYSHNLVQYIKRPFHLMAKSVEVISVRKILLGTSLEVMAVKGGS